MTLPRFLALSRYWAKHPPVHLMVAAYLGIGKKAGRQKTDGFEKTGGFAELLGMFPTGRIE
jgi:hypothetical protein